MIKKNIIFFLLIRK